MYYYNLRHVLTDTIATILHYFVINNLHYEILASFVYTNSCLFLFSSFLRLLLLCETNQRITYHLHSDDGSGSIGIRRMGLVSIDDDWTDPGCFIMAFGPFFSAEEEEDDLKSKWYRVFEDLTRSRFVPDVGAIAVLLSAKNQRRRFLDGCCW